MPEPFTQFGAGCDIFAPMVRLEIVLGHTAGPQSVYQHSGAVDLFPFEKVVDLGNVYGH